jgi:hypothetical protein
MQDYNELTRRPSPAGRPQPLAFIDDTLWVGCWDTSRLYAIDTATWKIRDEAIAPGKPFGLAAQGGTLRVVISLGEAEDRYLYRFVPGTGFDLESKTACPEVTGSHLASDGTNLYLAQLTNRRILVLDTNLSVIREIALPTRCTGLSFDGGIFYIIQADEEFDELALATFDIRVDRPRLEIIAPMPAESRGLARSGGAWWTNQRELNEIVSFSLE